MDRHTPLHPTIAIIGVCLVWYGFLFFGRPEQPIIGPDSQSYLNFFSFRSAGYPAFLNIITLSMVTWVQPLLAAVSLAYLSQQTYLLTKSIIAPLLLIILIIANYRFNSYHYSVFTESIYMSILMLIMGSWIRYSIKRNLMNLVVTSILIGLAITIRPAAIFLVPLLIVLFSLRTERHSGKKHLGAKTLFMVALIPALILVAFERTFSYYWHDKNTTSLLGRHLFAKAALIGENQGESSDVYENALNKEFEAVRTFIRNAPEFSVKNRFVAEYEVCIQYECSAELGLEAGSTEARNAAIERIARYPIDYMQLAFFNFRSLWTIYSPDSKNASQSINQYLQENGVIPHEKARYWLKNPMEYGGIIKSATKAVVLGIGFLSFLTMMQTTWLWTRQHHFSQTEIVNVFCAFGLHGALATVALTGPGLTRYLIVLWPMIILYAVLLMESALSTIVSWYQISRHQNQVP